VLTGTGAAFGVDEAPLRMPIAKTNTPTPTNALLTTDRIFIESSFEVLKILE